MLGITWKGKSLTRWWEQKLREEFCKREVKQGKIMIVWRDIDDMVYGWNMSADDEAGLGMVAGKIAEVKHKKLVHIINGKGDKHGQSNQ